MCLKIWTPMEQEEMSLWERHSGVSLSRRLEPIARKTRGKRISPCPNDTLMRSWKRMRAASMTPGSWSLRERRKSSSRWEMESGERRRNRCIAMTAFFLTSCLGEEGREGGKEGENVQHALTSYIMHCVLELWSV